MQAKNDKRHSAPTVKENRKIERSEQWEWTSREFFRGESCQEHCHVEKKFKGK